MPVSRMDIDGKGAGSPEGIVALILKHEPDLAPPVPIEELCAKLDIIEIRRQQTESFEGMLLTHEDKHSGIIVVNEASIRQRQRFTIGHELGHFLIPTHKPPGEAGFQCTRADMLRQTAKQDDRRAGMEVEANRFSSLILIPPPFLRKTPQFKKPPDLQHIPQLARQFDVSKEAMARAYAETFPEPIAIIVTQNGRVLRSYRNRLHFPFIQVDRGQPVPRQSLFHRGGHERSVASAPADCLPDLWIDVKRGERAPEMTEQVYPQQNGFALILLHLVRPDEDEEIEDRELERSWEVRFRR